MPDSLITPMICDACESPLPPYRFIKSFPYDGRQCACQPPVSPLPVAPDAMATITIVPLPRVPLEEAIDTAVIATAGLRPAFHALEEIANLQDTCPLAAERALRGLREVKDAIVNPPDDLYARQLQDAMDRVSPLTLDAAFGQGRN
jgi:hypothetical protein